MLNGWASEPQQHNFPQFPYKCSNNNLKIKVTHPASATPATTCLYVRLIMVPLIIIISKILESFFFLGKSRNILFTSCWIIRNLIVKQSKAKPGYAVMKLEKRFANISYTFILPLWKLFVSKPIFPQKTFDGLSIIHLKVILQKKFHLGYNWIC